MTKLQTTAILSTLAIATGLLASSLVNQMAPGSRYAISPALLPVVTPIPLIIVVVVLVSVSA